MKRQIHAYRGHGEIAVEGHNIKLGRGGIREIEFFVQTQQLIAGGRHPELRGRETLPTLDDARRGRLDRRRRARRSRRRPIASCARSSIACRWSPTSRPTRCRPIAKALERFARFLGFEDRDAFAEALLGASAQGAAPLREAVRERAGSRGRAARAVVSRRGRRPRDARQARRDGLPPAARSLRHGARAGSPARYRSLKGEFARDQLAELVPLLLDQFARVGKSRRGADRVRPLPRRPARRRRGCSRCCGRIPIWSRCSR